MPGVHAADRFVELVVQRDDRRRFGRAHRLVQQVVPRDLGTTTVVHRQCDPESGGAGLKLGAAKELVAIHFAGMVLVALPAGRAVQVEDCVDVVGRAGVQEVIEQFQSLRHELAGMGIVFNIAVPERNSHDIRARVCKTFDVPRACPCHPPGALQLPGLFRAESAGEHVPKRLVIANRRKFGGVGIQIQRRQPRLHHKRAAQVEPAENDDLSRGIHQVRPAGMKPGHFRGCRRGRAD